MNSKAEIVFYVVIGVYKDLYGIFYHFFEKWAHTPKYLTTGVQLNNGRSDLVSHANTINND